MTTQINEYKKYSFESLTNLGDNICHDVYQRGNGAPVLIIQELPGIGQATLRLADKFVEQGFTVFMPHLFGSIGKVSMVGNLARVFCMRKEFHLFSANKCSPIVDWLKTLCRDIKHQEGAKGVGVIGMCLTGNFAISLIGDDSVLAAVASQPAMPLHKQNSLHMSDEETQEVKDGIDKSAPMKAYRFELDLMSTAAKFQCISEKLNADGKNRVDLKTLPGKGHSVLTLDFVDQAGHPTSQALDEILDYFKTQLN